MLLKSFGGTHFIAYGNLVSPSLISHSDCEPSLANWDNKCCCCELKSCHDYGRKITQRDKHGKSHHYKLKCLHFALCLCWILQLSHHFTHRHQSNPSPIRNWWAAKLRFWVNSWSHFRVKLSSFKCCKERLQSCTKTWDCSIMTTIGIGSISPNLFDIEYDTMEMPTSWGSKHEWWASLSLGYCHLFDIHKPFSISLRESLVLCHYHVDFRCAKFDSAIDLDIYHLPRSGKDLWSV